MNSLSTISNAVSSGFSSIYNNVMASSPGDLAKRCGTAGLSALKQLGSFVRSKPEGVIGLVVLTTAFYVISERWLNKEIQSEIDLEKEMIGAAKKMGCPEGNIHVSITTSKSLKTYRNIILCAICLGVIREPFKT